MRRFAPRRLWPFQYTPEQLVDPPHTYGSADAATQQLGVSATAALLAPRLLLTIPGHFRALARQTANAQDAFALENLGWLLMRAMRDDLQRAGNPAWWLPTTPSFVTPFPVTLPPVDTAIQTLLTQPGLTDSAVDAQTYTDQFAAWNNGLAGQCWRLETGRSPRAPEQPILAQLLPPLAAVDLSAAQQQAQQAWKDWLATVDQRFPQDAVAQTRALTRCAPQQLPAGVIQLTSLQGVALVIDYPALVGAPVALDLSVLGAVQPVFTALFHTLGQLGWTDLLFQTGGAACFRGTKQPPDPTSADSQASVARTMSNHSLGTAADFQTFENVQGSVGLMDPRIVALFEAFRFRWGRCFPVPDPMHFEYCGNACE